MTNEEDPQDPSAAANSQTPGQSPVTPLTAPRREIGADSNDRPDDSKETAKELAREFRWVEVMSLIINGVLAVVGVIALCIYNGQLNVMRGQLGEIIKQYPELQKSANAARDAAEISRESLEEVQRAFLIPGATPQIQETVQGATKFWTITPAWENFGTTPALHVAQHFDAQILPDEPDDKVFKGGPRKGASPIYIGPKIVSPVSPVHRPYDFFVVDKAPPPNRKRFLWGWAAYRDVFPKTKVHVTEYCLVMVELSHVTGSNPPQYGFGFHACAQHNCTDTDCKDYLSIAAEAMK